MCGRKPSADLVTSEQPSPSGWLARNRTAVAPNTTTSPRASKFCFLKLPIVFGYAVPFTAISKKQNRKGSPQSLIYPLKSKLTSFVIKQFFSFKKEHQTRLISLNLLSQVSVLLRSLRSPTQNFDSPFGLPQDDTLTLEPLWLLVTLSKRGS